MQEDVLVYSRNWKSHFENPVHQLCMKIKEEQEVSKLDFRKKNVIACTKIVTNAVYCMKHSLSSADFVRLNDKDELSSNDVSATKNDGPHQFFYYRTEVYRNCQCIKTAFTGVKSASFTLDKVTVGKNIYSSRYIFLQPG